MRTTDDGKSENAVRRSRGWDVLRFRSHRTATTERASAISGLTAWVCHSSRTDGQLSLKDGAGTKSESETPTPVTRLVSGTPTFLGPRTLRRQDRDGCSFGIGEAHSHKRFAALKSAGRNLRFRSRRIASSSPTKAPYLSSTPRPARNSFVTPFLTPTP